jgi:Ca2+-binding EF-hand superfamily protein
MLCSEQGSEASWGRGSAASHSPSTLPSCLRSSVLRGHDPIDPDIVRQRRALLKTKSSEVQKAISKLADIASKFSGRISGFDSVSLSPTEFREVFRRNFGVLLSPSELGALVCVYDRTGERRLDCSDFLKEFWQLRTQLRAKREEEALASANRLKMQQRKREEAKIRRMTELKKAHIAGKFSEADEQSAIEKISRVAAYYDLSRSGRLTCFSEGGPLDPTSFREALRNNLGITLTPAELAVLMQTFDKDGDGTVDGGEFLYQFNLLGRERRANLLRQKWRKDEQVIARRQQQIERAKQKLGAQTRAKVNWEYTDEDRESAIRKIARQATNYDPLSNAGLSEIVAGEMDPTAFRTQLRQTFGVRTLTPSELGALFHVFDKDRGGTIDGGEFLTAFFRIGRQERNVQLAEAVKVKERRRRMQQRYAKEMEERHKRQTMARVKWPELEDDPFESYAASVSSSIAGPESDTPCGEPDLETSQRRKAPAPTEKRSSGDRGTIGKPPTATVLPQITLGTRKFLTELEQEEHRIRSLKLAGAGRRAGGSAPSSAGGRRRRTRKKKRGKAPFSEMSRKQSDKPMSANTEQQHGYTDDDFEEEHDDSTS